MPLSALLALDDPAFRALFAGTPIKRTGRDRFVRNAAIAAGNSGDSGLAEPLTTLLDDASPLVRGAATWALAQLDSVRFEKERDVRRAAETDPSVCEEWMISAPSAH
jgi:epoxyqueuosine reductase